MKQCVVVFGVLIATVAGDAPALAGGPCTAKNVTRVPSCVRRLGGEIHIRQRRPAPQEGEHASPWTVTRPGGRAAIGGSGIQVLVFSHPFCGPCRREVPLLGRLHTLLQGCSPRARVTEVMPRSLRDEIVDLYSENPKNANVLARTWMDKRGQSGSRTYPLVESPPVIDESGEPDTMTSRLHQAFGVTVNPTFIVLRDGEVLLRKEGTDALNPGGGTDEAAKARRMRRKVMDLVNARRGTRPALTCGAAARLAAPGVEPADAEPAPEVETADAEPASLPEADPVAADGPAAGDAPEGAPRDMSASEFFDALRRFWRNLWPGR